MDIFRPEIYPLSIEIKNVKTEDSFEDHFELRATTAQGDVSPPIKGPTAAVVAAKFGVFMIGLQNAADLADLESKLN